MISSRTHGILDYVVGALLIVLPFLLGLDSTSAEAWVLAGAGIAALIYSLLTDYELGLVRVLPMSAHLALDIVSGLFVTASPWLFGFADRVYVPHLVVGVFELVVASLSQRTAYTRKTTT